MSTISQEEINRSIKLLDEMMSISKRLRQIEEGGHFSIGLKNAVSHMAASMAPVFEEIAKELKEKKTPLVISV